MQLTREIFSLNLSSSEFKVYALLCTLSDDAGKLEVTTEELADMLSCSTESLRRAFRGLEEHGVLTVTRTKRNFGRFWLNRYQVHSPSHKVVDAPPHKNVGSTHDSSSDVTVTTETVRKKNTTYSFVRAEPNTEKGLTVVFKYDDDDDIAGVGLFDEEVQAKKTPTKINKRSTKTRGLRPEEEWTTYDIAAEFSYQLSLKFPLVPGLVNASKISGALRQYRTKYGTNGLIEMEIMRAFFADDRNYRDAEKEYMHLAGRYLAMFKTHLGELARELDTPTVVVSQDFVYASDGRKFENTTIGRRRMEQHEALLQEETK
jgi:hypothetical protein